MAPPKSKAKAKATSKAVDFYQSTQLGRDQMMLSAAAREHSFRDKDWPFQEDCQCTPKKMAEAGFYFVGTEQEPDLARCYYCRRELDGWEPEDDPWEEHKRRPCPFIQLGKKNGQKISLNDQLKLEGEKLRIVITKETERRTELLKAAAEAGRERIENLARPATKAARGRRKRKN